MIRVTLDQHSLSLLQIAKGTLRHSHLPWLLVALARQKAHPHYLGAKKNARFPSGLPLSFNPLTTSAVRKSSYVLLSEGETTPRNSQPSLARAVGFGASPHTHTHTADGSTKTVTRVLSDPFLFNVLSCFEPS